MAKMWAGRTDGVTDSVADDFNSSLRIDRRMVKQDIVGSMAHAQMLGKQGIITADESEALINGLSSVLADLESGALAFDETSEDVHMFVEQELTKRLGDVGKKLHTARSRNDQVTLDTRMYLRDRSAALRKQINELLAVLCDLSEENKDAILPGYTHLQRAQPITFGHHLMAYAMMLLRDRGRLDDAVTRMNVCPIGSCALAGTTYQTDRRFEARLLGFSDIARNSMDGVSDRDYCLELLSCLSIAMMHLSRLAEEILLWTSWEFRFAELSDAYTTGSSIMPQKKNSDMAELIRGKTGRVYGDLIGLLTTMKGLPLAYNKDMQEDKEGVFDAFDTVELCMKVLTPMLATMKINRERMKSAAQGGFINATDLADYLVRKGLPFRSAYKISGQIVSRCIADGQVLETLPLEIYRSYSELFDSDVYDAVDLTVCVEKRLSEGGTSVKSVEAQLKWVREQL